MKKIVSLYLSFLFVMLFIFSNLYNVDGSLTYDEDNPLRKIEIPSTSNENFYKFPLVFGIIVFTYTIALVINFKKNKSLTGGSIISGILNFIAFIMLFLTTLNVNFNNYKECSLLQLNFRDKNYIITTYKLLYIIFLISSSIYTYMYTDIPPVLNILAVTIMSIIFQTFLPMLFIPLNEQSGWPNILDYIEELINNSDYEESSGIHTGFKIIGSIRIILIIVLIYLALNNNKDISNLKSVYKLIIGWVAFILLIILSQLFIIDGCVINRTLKKYDEKYDNFKDAFINNVKCSISNQGGLNLHILLISIFSFVDYLK